MIDLWMALVGLSVLALVFIAWPLFRQRSRDIDTEYNRSEANVELYKSHMAELDASYAQGDLEEPVYEQLKAELGRALLEDNEFQQGIKQKNLTSKPILVACLVAIPAVSLAFYYWHGFHNELELRDLVQAQSRALNESRGSVTGEAIDATKKLVDKLEVIVAKDSEDIQNRYLLARNLNQLQDYRGAMKAYQEILNVSPEEPQILAEFAQTLLMASGKEMLPQVQQLADQALALEPNHALGLSVAGIAAYHQEDYAKAREMWQRAVVRMGPNNPEARPLLAGLANLDEIAPETSEASAESEVPEPADSKAVSIKVALDDKVNATPDQIVFVYARAWQGPKMPLAIQRLSVADLPATVTLDESMAMIENMTIGTFGEVELVARISEDGGPIAKPGDWQASVGPVAQDKFGEIYELTIDSQVQ